MKTKDLFSVPIFQIIQKLNVMYHFFKRTNVITEIDNGIAMGLKKLPITCVITKKLATFNKNNFHKFLME